MALLQAILEENKIRKNRIFRDRLNPLDAYDDAEILSRYRMTRHCLMDVIDMVRKDVSHETKRSHALTPEEQTFAALRYYATGSFQQVIGDILGLSQPSVSRAVKNVSNALVGAEDEGSEDITPTDRGQDVVEGEAVRASLIRAHFV
ncbi:putative nuclease HARBI1 [Saccostrea cucullata]|uniref:putative nuclease HARBI1 n=1 Tax=Saccostrea cuccullata TaxID=36930 RepID=UPI002ED1D099